MKKLDLSVALDFYVTETTSQCDYILPTTTCTSGKTSLLSQTFRIKPFRQSTPAVIAPRGQARTEWDIIDDLMARMAGRTTILKVFAGVRSLDRRAGRRFSLRQVVDGIIRFGPRGDRGGFRRGLSFTSLMAEHPHGAVLAEELATGVLRSVVSYRGRRDPVGAQRDRCRYRYLGSAAGPRELPAAADRDTGFALGELLDAQLPVADAG